MTTHQPDTPQAVQPETRPTREEVYASIYRWAHANALIGEEGVDPDEHRNARRCMDDVIDRLLAAPQPASDAEMLAGAINEAATRILHCRGAK